MTRTKQTYFIRRAKNCVKNILLLTVLASQSSSSEEGATLHGRQPGINFGVAAMSIVDEKLHETVLEQPNSVANAVKETHEDDDDVVEEELISTTGAPPQKVSRARADYEAASQKEHSHEGQDDNDDLDDEGDDDLDDEEVEADISEDDLIRAVLNTDDDEALPEVIDQEAEESDIEEIKLSESPPDIDDDQDSDNSPAKENDEKDYVTEETRADGTHIRKEVHEGPGFRSVRITSDGGPGGAGGMPFPGGGPGGIMKAIMQDMMNAGPGGGATIRIGGPGPLGGGGIIGGPPGGMVIRKQIIVDDDDDDDDVPPEIVNLMRMTEGLISGGGMFGHRTHVGVAPNHQKIAKSSEPRQDESVDDIMKRMDKLSVEIGEKHEENRIKAPAQRNQRFTQVMTIMGVVIVVLAVSFILTCKSKKGEDDDSTDTGAASRGSSQRNRVAKAD